MIRTICSFKYQRNGHCPMFVYQMTRTTDMRCSRLERRRRQDVAGLPADDGDGGRVVTMHHESAGMGTAASPWLNSLMHGDFVASI
jgi:hypothetical protein